MRAGDTVTLTVNGVQSQGVVESVEGALRFSAEVQGSDLVADGDLTIDAAITTTDDAGNISEVATDVQTYTVDLEAFATITVEVLPELEGVALENAIAVAAYRGDTLNITGVAGLDAADAGEITLTVNGNSYTGTLARKVRIALPSLQLTWLMQRALLARRAQYQSRLRQATKLATRQQRLQKPMFWCALFSRCSSPIILSMA